MHFLAQFIYLHLFLNTMIRNYYIRHIHNWITNINPEAPIFKDCYGHRRVHVYIKTIELNTSSYLILAHLVLRLGYRAVVLQSSILFIVSLFTLYCISLFAFKGFLKHVNI